MDLSNLYQIENIPNLSSNYGSGPAFTKLLCVNVGSGIYRTTGQTCSLLQDLDLSENLISSLPESIKGLIGPRSFRLSHCTRLQSLPELPMGLELLDVGECSSLEMITNLPNWTTYLALKTAGCEKLVEVQGIFKLKLIGNVDAKIVNSLGLTELESMGSLEKDGEDDENEVNK
ncbi:hypothetical protein ACSBR2_022882 [Camellia fascicularis]